MPPPSQPDLPEETAGEQLADLLEACLRAERAVPGSAARIVESAPKQLRTDLEQLLVLAQRLWSAHDGDLAPETRQVLRVRITSRIAPRFRLQVTRTCMTQLHAFRSLLRSLVNPRSGKRQPDDRLRNV